MLVFQQLIVRPVLVPTSPLVPFPFFTFPAPPTYLYTPYQITTFLLLQFQFYLSSHNVYISSRFPSLCYRPVIHLLDWLRDLMFRLFLQLLISCRLLLLGFSVSSSIWGSKVKEIILRLRICFFWRVIWLSLVKFLIQ